MRKIALTAALLCMLLPLAAQDAGTRDASAVSGAIQKKYASIKDFSFPFTQETLIKELKEKTVYTGRAWFKKPAMMKWQYEQPWKDTIVSDGKKLRYFDSRENQVTEVDIGSVWGNSFDSYTVISILEDVERLFSVRQGTGSTDEQGNILLDSKQSAQENSKQVTIAVDSETYMLRKIITADVFGNTTVIDLGIPEINTNIPDSFFTFRNPEGASTATFP